MAIAKRGGLVSFLADNKHEDRDGLDYQIKVLLNTFDDELEKTFLNREFEKIGSVPEKVMFLDSLLSKPCEYIYYL